MIYLREAGRENGRRMAIFKCPYCGKEVKRWYYNGIRQKSCGCWRGRPTHHQSGTRLYRIWANIRQRCLNPNIPDYQYYGAKGIKVCDEWKNSFESFMAWALQNGYADGLTIDRIDSSGDYEPKNCRWITQSENVSRANRERSRPWAKLTPSMVRQIRDMAGRLSQREIARRLGVSPKIVWKVIHRKTYRWVR